MLYILHMLERLTEKNSKAEQADLALVLGSGQYIDGFEDGVVGMTIGETKDLNLTFPDPYQNNEDLSGKAVVFSVTLNSITRSFPELTEDWVKTYTEYASMDEYRASIKENLVSEAESTATQNLQSSAWEAFAENCEVKQYQQSKIDSAKTSIEQNITYYATMAGTDLAGYKTQMGYTDEQYDNICWLLQSKSAKAYMAIDAIVDAEGFTTEDKEYQDLLADTMAQYEMTEDQLYEEYGEDTVYDYIMRTRVMNLVIDSADITEETVTAEEAEAAASEVPITSEVVE